LATNDVTFSVPVPQGRDRIRVALGGPSSRSALNFRIDLRSATVEPEALAAVIH